MKKITSNQYNSMVDKKIPGSSLFIKSIKAFFTGGSICLIGQIVYNFIEKTGISNVNVSTFTSMFMVFAGALLTGLDIYNKLAKFGGAGTLVPITGFANAIVSPAMEFKSEGYVLGLGAKMFIIAGPVLVYGIVSSVVCGLLLILGRVII